MKARNGFVVVAALVAGPAAAHHGIGTFDTRREITISGAVTGIDFVNPHAYLYLDAAGNDGKVAAWKCEMRSATTLRRSGWSPEMFKPGTQVTITGALALRLGYQVRHNTDVLPGIEKTDTLTTVGLLYETK